jgi:hypothetical protein
METMALSLVILVGAGALFWLYWQLRRRGMNVWLGRYLLETGKRRVTRPGEEVHLLLCVADHFEPKENERVSPAAALARVRHWVEQYPKQLGGFRDSDGRPPRHTFFFPLEDYEPEHLDALAKLCAAGFGEVEVHLHHENDTAEALRARLLAFKEHLAGRHGLLSRDRETGELAYGFIHGDWALNNARPDGRRCGVNNELAVLRETGCYADFTLPSAPSATQTRKINSIYYAWDVPGRPKSHDTGVDVGTRPAPPGGLLLVQGPLVLAWRRRKWGIFPRLENACIQAGQPPSLGRLRDWLRARIQVPGRPDWFFVKLHTHGAGEENHAVLLGEPALRFHRELAEHARANPHFHYHYVTAREMYNLVRAAEAGWKGSVDHARNYRLIPNCPGATRSSSSDGHQSDRALDPAAAAL